ncbi:hypothetical protein CHISP_2491 [Chitinispirillum alkaliphilum]|nr:hypothetical protein CHISP_2491 [Chitinispirillum alkaliphilum]
MKSEFRYLNLSVWLRLVLMISLYATAIFLQDFYSNFWIGLPFILAAYPFILMKPISNMPYQHGVESWAPVSEKEIERLGETLSESELIIKANLPQCYLSIGAVVLAGIGGFISLIIGNFEFMEMIVTAFLILLPAIYFGNMEVYFPDQLAMKYKCFSELTEIQAPQGYFFSPYLSFDENTTGKPIPKDIRFMLKKEKKSEDFIGVQFQVAINDGPDGAVPYMYAVVLTKGKDNCYWKLVDSDEIEFLKKKFIFEKDGDGDNEYGTLVIRQDTGSGGYVTLPSEIHKLFKTVIYYLEFVGESQDTAYFE